MLVGIATVTALWVLAPAAVAWPWYVPIGCGITVALGWGLGRGRPSPVQGPDAPNP